MSDKILDDDDIIDLTDLLEEGEPRPAKGKKEAGPSVRAPANEPDSFDLGKEISMEYDVSVEEIEQGTESLDVDAGLSPGEEIALSPENGEDKGVALPRDIQGQSEFAEAAGEPRAEALAPGASAEAARETAELTGDAQALSYGEEPAAERPETKTAGEIDAGPVRQAGAPVVPEQIIGEMKNEIPAMIEEIVRPIFTELVRELVAATREQLPGIIEKVIREEIEKLKKLDS